MSNHKNALCKQEAHEKEENKLPSLIFDPFGIQEKDECETINVFK